MEKNEKKSKVALCKKCGGFIQASHIDYIDKKTEKKFTQFTNEGYDVKIEFPDKTRSREWVGYSDKKNGKCEECNNPKK